MLGLVDLAVVLIMGATFFFTRLLAEEIVCLCASRDRCLICTVMGMGDFSPPPPNYKVESPLYTQRLDGLKSTKLSHISGKLSQHPCNDEGFHSLAEPEFVLNSPEPATMNS